MQKKATILIIAAIGVFLMAMVAIFTIDVKDSTAIKAPLSQQSRAELQ